MRQDAGVGVVETPRIREINAGVAMSVPGVGLRVRQKKAPVCAGAEGSTGEVQVLQPTPIAGLA
jgi:hypothetical protein